MKKRKKNHKYLMWAVWEGSMKESTRVKERIHRPIGIMEVCLTQHGICSTVSQFRVGVWEPNFWPKILGFSIY